MYSDSGQWYWTLLGDQWKFAGMHYAVDFPPMGHQLRQFSSRHLYLFLPLRLLFFCVAIVSFWALCQCRDVFCQDDWYIVSGTTFFKKINLCILMFMLGIDLTAAWDLHSTPRGFQPGLCLDLQHLSHAVAGKSKGFSNGNWKRDSVVPPPPPMLSSCIFICWAAEMHKGRILSRSQ